VGWIWTRIPDEKSGTVAREFEPKNPLELRAAFLFGSLFLAMLIATHPPLNSTLLISVMLRHFRRESDEG
jgi:uncharacterized membrane protein (DUF4010 family)